jgi:hypothetical protein
MLAVVKANVERNNAKERWENAYAYDKRMT